MIMIVMTAMSTETPTAKMSEPMVIMAMATMTTMTTKTTTMVVMTTETMVTWNIKEKYKELHLN